MGPGLGTSNPIMGQLAQENVPFVYLRLGEDQYSLGLAEYLAFQKLDFDK